MRMKTNIFKALSLFAAALLLTATSCTKEDNGGAEEPLEVNRNNISGSWELVSWNGKPLEGGTYLHLTLVRNDATFTLSWAEAPSRYRISGSAPTLPISITLFRLIALSFQDSRHCSGVRVASGHQRIARNSLHQKPFLASDEFSFRTYTGKQLG